MIDHRWHEDVVARYIQIQAAMSKVRFVHDCNWRKGGIQNCLRNLAVFVEYLSQRLHRIQAALESTDGAFDLSAISPHCQLNVILLICLYTGGVLALDNGHNDLPHEYPWSCHRWLEVVMECMKFLRDQGIVEESEVEVCTKGLCPVAIIKSCVLA